MHLDYFARRRAARMFGIPITRLSRNERDIINVLYGSVRNFITELDRFTSLTLKVSNLNYTMDNTLSLTFSEEENRNICHRLEGYKKEGDCLKESHKEMNMLSRYLSDFSND